MKRIGIDARFYGLGSAGLARFTQELIEHLVRVKSSYQYVVFVRSEDVSEFTIEQDNVELRATDIPHYTLREQLFFKRELEHAHLDLVHFLNFNYPISYKAPFILSIHDLTLLSFSGRSRLSRLKAKPLDLVFRRGTANARMVMTVSEYQKQLIARTYGTDPEKIRVVYEAVDERFKPLDAKTVEAFRQVNGLTKPFMMYTGQWRQHKNLVRLLKAFKQVRQSQDVQLVLVGKIDPAFPIIPQTIRDFGLEQDVILTDFVPDEELPTYYAAADLFVFPSLEEGFGLPPLEAMACGTTVASSNASVMPEVLGEAAIYFNPHSVEDMTNVLGKLMKDQKLRGEYRKKGFAQVQKYSWERTAAETLALYDDVLRGS